jgi:hypothetical protein
MQQIYVKVVLLDSNRLKIKVGTVVLIDTRYKGNAVQSLKVGNSTALFQANVLTDRCDNT